MLGIPSLEKLLVLLCFIGFWLIGLPVFDFLVFGFLAFDLLFVVFLFLVSWFIGFLVSKMIALLASWFQNF